MLPSAYGYNLIFYVQTKISSITFYKIMNQFTYLRILSVQLNKSRFLETIIW